MNVVLDSNILCADYRMEGNAFRVLLAALPRVGVTVYIPQIVIDEVINRYSEDLGKLVSSHERLLGTWHQLTGRELRITEQPWRITDQVTAYKEHLAARLKSVGGKILPYPDIPHEILIRRSLERRRPFQDEGRGYRDALIWEAVLSLCKKEGSTTLLITKNRRDFGDGPQPHFDLLRDLRDVGLTEEALRVIKSLEDFNNEFLVPQLERLDKMIRRFSEDEVPEFSLNRWVQSELKEVLSDQEWAATLVGIEESHSRASVGSCQQTKSGDPSAWFTQTPKLAKKRRSSVATLSDRDMRDIADYFASRKPVRGSFSLDARKVARGKAKAEELRCAACHMPDFSGKKEVPRLAGLDPNYIGPQIVAFTAGKRAHPPVDGMSGLSEEDAESLAQYLAQLE